MAPAEQPINGTHAVASGHTITHVVFDMDGLLLDTEGFYSEVSQAILDRYGKIYTWEIKRAMMGKVARDAAVTFIEATGIDMTPEAYLREREAGLARLFPTCKLMPGAERLVRHLKAHGIPIAVATSSYRAHFELKSTNHKPFFALFDAIVTGDDADVRAGKPAPDIFLVAAGRLRPPPATMANVLVFEDAPNGVLAALAAGMPVVMVPDERVSEADRRPATLVLRSLLDFNPTQWGLPSF